MAYVAHTKIVLSGTMGLATPPPEAFSLSIRTSHFVAVDQDYCDEVWDLAAAWFADSGVAISSCVKLTKVKVADIGTDGKYVTAGVSFEHVGSVAGASGASPHPFQIALCASLVTGLDSPRGRGRFYIPGVTGDVNVNTGLLSDDARDAVQTATATFLTAINDAAAPVLGTVIVASSFGTGEEVVGVRVGRVFDTIRSRRRSLDETYDPMTAL